jgi:hypothetical protein
MSQVDLYLTNAHSARGRTTYVGIAMGALAGALVEGISNQFKPAFVVCIIVTGVVEVISASWYREPSRKDRRTLAAFPVRRNLMWALASGAMLLVVAKVGIPRIEVLACERKLQQFSDNPTDQRSIIEAQKVITRARTAGIRIAPSNLQATGDKFVEASAKNPAAWDAALALQNYRSFLNGPNLSMELFYSLDRPPIPGIETTYYQLGDLWSDSHPRVTTSIKRVPIDVAAQSHVIGQPLRQIAHEGPEAILGVGGEIRLDNMYVRNLVYEEMTIHYSGGPVILNNVMFINCRFVIDNVPNGRALGSQILAATRISFHTPDTA